LQKTEFGAFHSRSPREGKREIKHCATLVAHQTSALWYVFAADLAIGA
jgi:hypothetical protein